MNIVIRSATVADAAKILEIYAPYISDTSVSFETEVPTAAQFAGRIENIVKPELFTQLRNR